MDFGMNFRVKWMFEEDWKEDTLDRLGRKVMRMVMPVMLVLVPNAAVDIASATDQYSSGTAARGTGKRTCWTGLAGR